MTESQSRPDQRIIDCLREIVRRMPNGAELSIQKFYLRYAGWAFGADQYVMLELVDNDELVIRSSWLGADTFGIGLTGTRFSSILLDPSPNRRLAFHTEEELVDMAIKLIYNRLP